jgi:hypothetical protein
LLSGTASSILLRSISDTLAITGRRLMGPYDVTSVGVFRFGYHDDLRELPPNRKVARAKYAVVCVCVYIYILYIFIYVMSRMRSYLKEK